MRNFYYGNTHPATDTLFNHTLWTDGEKENASEDYFLGKLDNSEENQKDLAERRLFALEEGEAIKQHREKCNDCDSVFNAMKEYQKETLLLMAPKLGGKKWFGLLATTVNDRMRNLAKIDAERLQEFKKKFNLD